MRAAEVLLQARDDGKQKTSRRDSSDSTSSSASSSEDRSVHVSKRKRQWIELADHQRRLGENHQSQSSLLYADRPSILSRLSHPPKSRVSPPRVGAIGDGTISAEPLSTNKLTLAHSARKPARPISIRTASPNSLICASALSLLSGNDLSPRSLGAESPPHMWGGNSDVVRRPCTKDRFSPHTTPSCGSSNAFRRSRSLSSQDSTSSEDVETPYKIRRSMSLRDVDSFSDQPLLTSINGIKCLFPNSDEISLNHVGSHDINRNWTKPVVDVMKSVSTVSSTNF